MILTPNHYPINIAGLIGWWSYRNPGSVSPLGSWKDYSGNGNNGVCVANSFVDNFGVNLDGDADYLELGTIASGNPLMLAGSDVTVLVSLYWKGTGDTYQRVFDKSSAGASINGYSLYVDSSLMYFGTAGVNAVVTSSGIVVPNEWHRYAITFVSGTNQHKIYRDGSVVPTVNAVGTIPNVETGMRIGSWNHTTGREFNGYIDDLQIYNRALSPGEVMADSLKNRRN